jgi:hypothetical protein
VTDGVIMQSPDRRPDFVPVRPLTACPKYGTEEKVRFSPSNRPALGGCSSEAEAAWAAFEAVQRVFGGPFANSFANSATSGGGETAPPEKRPVLENTERKRSRPGVIRTHDQGIMSGDEPEQ